MILAWMFVLVPLLLFVLGFATEAFISFRRLRNPKKVGPYMDATWEVTHTFLVVAVAMFVSLFSNNLRDIADAVFVGIFTAAAFVGVRGLLYVYLFYVRAPRDRAVVSWLDWVFACSHLGILLGVGILLVQLVPKLFSINLEPNTTFYPMMWPGLLLVLALCVPPIVSLYRTKK